MGLQGKLNEQQRAAAKAKAEFFGRGARILANTPQGKRPGVYASLRAGLIQRGVAGENELPPEYSADIDQNLQMLGLESDALNEMLDETRYEPLTDSGGNIVGQRNMKTGKVESDPRAPKEVAPTEISKLIAEYNAMDEFDPNREIIKQRLMKLAQPTGTSLTVDADGNISFSQGGVSAPGNIAPTKSSMNTLQKDNTDAVLLLDQVDALAREYKDNYLGFGAETKQGLNRVRDRLDASGVPLVGLSDDQKEWQAGRTRFVQQTNRVFNNYRKLITGAAASVQELESLKKAIFNDELGPTEFKAAYDSYRNELQRVIRIRNRLMREGYDVGGRRFGGALDRRFMAGGDDDALDQFEYLVDKGVTEDEAADQLRRLGYDLSRFEAE